MPRTDALRAAAALLLAAAPAFAQSNPVATPFRDEPVALAQQVALARLGATARALSLVPPLASAGDDGAQAEGDDETGSQDQGEADEDGGPAADLAQFQASLAVAEPKLARALGSAVEGMSEAADAGKDAAKSAAEVAGLAEKAAAALPLPKAAEAPAFRAALIAGLLLGEGGVSDAYEAASGGDRAAYVAGYLMLQQVKALWQQVMGQAMPEQAADVAQMIGMLDALFPSEEPPAQLSPDPEEAEAPSHQIVTLLETITRAELYPGRDVAAAAGMVQDLAARGCTALASKKDHDLGHEQLTIAKVYYDQTLGDTLGVMAPDAASEIGEGFEAAARTSAAKAPAACKPLLAALGQGQAALTP